MNWTVTDSNGQTHNLACKAKAFTGPHITVDSNTYRVKSSNWFVNLVDYSVDFPGANCHIVMIGNKMRLAVNGVYQDDGSAYEPMTSIPAWIWVLVALSVIGGYCCGGIIGIAVGAVFSTMYITNILKKNTTKVFICFGVFVVIAIILLFLQFQLVALTNSVY